jgi:hypothetical protein
MTGKAWNGGTREAAIAASNARREAARALLHKKYYEVMHTLSPWAIDAPFRDNAQPGWVYLPIDDVVIMVSTAERLAGEAAMAAVHCQLDAARFRYLREVHAHHSAPTRETPAEWHIEWHWQQGSHHQQDWSLLTALDNEMGTFEAMQATQCEEELPPLGSGPMRASAGYGVKCADCSMDGEACPTCYAAWWRKRHPNVVEV